MAGRGFPGPLSGLRVVDASMGAVGPWAGVLLGQLGADVIKLEPPGVGDFIRTVMPTQRGLSSTYISMNFNKRGIVLDLKQPEQRRAAQNLIADADIFIENFRPGVAERIGLGWDELSGRNPRLIYASATGFGWSGPMVGIGATDPHIQAFSGSTSVNGAPDGPRQRIRWYGHFDVTTGQCIVEGVLAALYDRQRSGRGRRVEVTMVEAALSLQRVRIAEHLAGGRPRPMGSATTYLVPDQAFATQDRPIAVSVTSRAQWRSFCAAIDRAELIDDARFRTNPLRVQHRGTLLPTLEGRIRERPAGYWLRAFENAAVPCALFTSFDEFRHHRHYLENAFVTTHETPQWGRVTVAGVPWRFAKTPGELRPASAPGEHTADVLARGWA